MLQKQAWGWRKVTDQYRRKYIFTDSLHTQIDVLIHFSKAKPQSTAMSSFKTNFRKWLVKEQFFFKFHPLEKSQVFTSNFFLRASGVSFPINFITVCNVKICSIFQTCWSTRILSLDTRNRIILESKSEIWKSHLVQSLLGISQENEIHRCGPPAQEGVST